MKCLLVQHTKVGQKLKPVGSLLLCIAMSGSAALWLPSCSLRHCLAGLCVLMHVLMHIKIQSRMKHQPHLLHEAGSSTTDGE